MTKLPPDPEQMNDKRSTWADEALATFMKTTGTDMEDALSDLLADLRHWADRHGQNYDREAIRAECHYEAETNEECET